MFNRKQRRIEELEKERDDLYTMLGHQSNLNDCTSETISRSNDFLMELIDLVQDHQENLGEFLPMAVEVAETAASRTQELTNQILERNSYEQDEDSRNLIRRWRSR